MDDELISIEGTVESVTYYNSENGYTVLDFSSDGDYFTAVGDIGNVFPGEKLVFNGRWVKHPTFGKQLKVESVVKTVPESADEMLLFLSSGIVKGIREKTAQKIVDRFGDKAFEIIELYPDRLAEIKGITFEKAMDISREFGKLSAERNAVIALEKFGFTSNEAMKIFKHYGAKSAETVERNPYIICHEVSGIGFERVCDIAENLPVKPSDKAKYREGIIYVMQQNLYSNGHTCVPEKSLYKPCCDLLGCTADDIDEALDSLKESRRVIGEELYSRDFVFLPDMYEAEKNAAKALFFIKHFAAGTQADIDKQIERSEIISGVCYDDRQLKAIRCAVDKGILVLTGGPGTGKTTTLRAILNVFEARGLEVALAAPTGRAAKRMSELTGKEAQTIHRLLEVEWDEDRPTFKRNRSNPISAQALIVDELSMVDVKLFSDLLDALPIGCRLVMVGDSEQLPPVGPGNVLHDIIDSGAFPVVELKTVFRQALESMIITNAHRIVDGEMPELTATDNDFFFLERRDAESAAQTVCDLACTRLPAAYGYSALEDIQVLCPSRKGETGTANLNKLIQNTVNPHKRGKPEHQFGGRVFRLGDKLMQTRNNYDITWESSTASGIGIFNGDIGILENIDEDAQTLTVRFDDRTAVLPFEGSADLEHAYAVTVHKSQGSEFPAVIIPVTGVNPYLEYRNLLYTAVTRAKNQLVLVGTQATIKRMVDNNKKQKRYSALKSFIMSGEYNE